MKSLFLYNLIFGVLISCNREPAKKQPESLESKLKKEAISIASDYISKQLKMPGTTVDAYGVIIIKEIGRAHV